MSLKTIVVQLDHDDPAERLRLSVTLAQSHGARLIGLFAERSEAHRVGIVSTWPSDASRDAAAASRDAFTRATGELAGAEWRNANRGSPAEVIRAVAETAHTADLVILGQDEGMGREHAAVPAGLAEQVVMGAGCPALVIPGCGQFERIGRRPLVAWNNSRESARALRDALPLFGDAEEVIVATFVTKTEDEHGSVADCLRYLADHGVRARSECLVVEGIGVMDMLLSRVGDNGADLLVMGAHGHYGFPHLLRGNGTRHVLSGMTVPILMSN